MYLCACMSCAQKDKAAVVNEDAMGKHVADFFNNEPETVPQMTHVSKPVYVGN